MNLPQKFALRFKMYPKMTVYFPYPERKNILWDLQIPLSFFLFWKKGGWVRDVKVIAQTPIFSNHQKGYLDFSFAASSERCLCMTTHEWGLLKIETPTWTICFYFLRVSRANWKAWWSLRIFPSKKSLKKEIEVCSYRSSTSLSFSKDLKKQCCWMERWFFSSKNV